MKTSISKLTHQITSVPKKKNTKRSSNALLRLVFFLFGTDVNILKACLTIILKGLQRGLAHAKRQFFPFKKQTTSSLALLTGCLLSVLYDLPR